VTDCIYICSAGHSGSTLLDLLIGSHSSVASLGEISQLPKNIALNTVCTCGEPVRSCRLWQKVVVELDKSLGTDILSHPYSLSLGPFKAQVVVDKARQTHLRQSWQKIVQAFWYIDLRFGLKLLPPLTAEARRGVSNNFFLYDTIGKILDVKKVVDSSKSYMKAAELYRQCPERVKIILLVRDGRAVFYSGIKNGFRRERSLYVWQRAYTRALPILGKIVDADDILRVHYENLAKAPEAELQRICRFLGLEFEPGMLDFTSHEHHIANGNDMRFNKSSRIRFDDSWREGLSGPDLEYFRKHADYLNRSLGYTD